MVRVTVRRAHSLADARTVTARGRDRGRRGGSPREQTWRDPLGHFSYLTPAENLSALHFHSPLSAPLVGLGFHGGGRLVALALIVSSASSIGVYQLGVAHGSGLDVVGDERGEITRPHEGRSHERIVEPGRAVRRADVESASKVVFVGGWGRSTAATTGSSTPWAAS